MSAPPKRMSIWIVVLVVPLGSCGLLKKAGGIIPLHDGDRTESGSTAMIAFKSEGAAFIKHKDGTQRTFVYRGNAENGFEFQVGSKGEFTAEVPQRAGTVHGVTKQWAEGNGTLAIRKSFRDGLLEGPCEYRDSYGILDAEKSGWYSRGVRTRAFSTLELTHLDSGRRRVTRWWPNGRIAASIETTTDGTETRGREFYEDGKVESDYVLRRHEKSGRLRIWAKNGAFLGDVGLRDGEFEGACLVWTSDGARNPAKTGWFQGGQKVRDLTDAELAEHQPQKPPQSDR